VEEDAVHEMAPGGVVEQSIQQSSRCSMAERLDRAKEDFLRNAAQCRVAEDSLKEAEQRHVEQDLLREAALSCVDELLAREERPRPVADVSVREEALELISQDLSLQAPPHRVAEEPLWLFGLEIQRGHLRDGRHPRRGVPEKGHCHHKEQSPGQTPKGSVAQPEVPASESQRGVEPVVAVEEGWSGRH
jgi:hypothetical protein